MELKHDYSEQKRENEGARITDMMPNLDKILHSFEGCANAFFLFFFPCHALFYLVRERYARFLKVFFLFE